MVLLNNYQTPVKATLKFLSFLKVKVNTGMVNKILQTHPDWLSLQSPVLKNEYETKIIFISDRIDIYRFKCLVSKQF